MAKEPLIWRDLPRYSKHTWAFFYYLRRAGDNPRVVLRGQTMDIIVEKLNDIRRDS